MPKVDEPIGSANRTGGVNKPTTQYFYDGQMSFEDDHTVPGGEGT